MTDFIDQYRQRARKRLSRKESEPVVRMAEVLCFPSFHAETLLRVTESPNGTAFRLSTFSSSLWYSEDGKEPRRFQETVEVSPDQAGRFWESMTALDPASLCPKKALGLDGMSISATYRDGEAESQFETWCPAPESPEGQYVGLIYRLAWEVVQADTSIERLEHLHGYLRLGLPARVIDGELKCLRLFGSLSSSDEPALRRTFESIDGDKPLLVDMTNFHGMGTLLYPAFVDFASGRTHLVWAVSKSARQHIDSMGINEQVLFDSVADAVEWIRKQGGA